MPPVTGSRRHGEGGLTVLGVDPGLTATGFGVVLADGNDYSSLDLPSGEPGFGVISPSRRLPHAERLQVIFDGLTDVIRAARPDEIAVEDFIVGHVRAAVAVGEARATALLAAAQAGVPVSLYKPSEVKQFVTSYGRGSKEQVQEMVRSLLGLDAPPQSADAADALAVALCHCLKRHAQLVEASL
jgi:crossover junction endodeoxyribonuclease RuvC